MRRLAELTAFLALSAAVHAGAAWQFGAIGSNPGQGAGGADRITLAAAPDSAARLIETWETPPDTVQTVAQRPLPDMDAQPPSVAAETAAPVLSVPDMPSGVMPDTAPRAPQTTSAPPRPRIASMPDMPVMPTRFAASGAIPLPDADIAPDRTTPPALAPAAAPEMPSPDTTAAPPPVTERAVAQSPRPVLRPDPAPPAPPSPPSTPQPARVAAGNGTGITQGAANAPATGAALSAGQRQTLMSQWGGAILSRIERSRPRARGTGQVVVQLRLTPGGQLTGVSVSQSSGDAALDQAAVAAVQSVGRFPAAPNGLTDASYGFSLPIRFR